jgi:hypothetical protein
MFLPNYIHTPLFSHYQYESKEPPMWFCLQHMALWLVSLIHEAKHVMHYNMGFRLT